MIIKLLMDQILFVFGLLTAAINVPSLPPEVAETVGTMLEYVSMGISFMGNFVNMPYLLVLFNIIVGADVAVLIYRLVMWVMRKIPMIGVS